MPTPPPDYLSAAAGQLAVLSAVLGGFAVAFLAALLPLAGDDRRSAWCVGGAAAAATSFTVATIAATLLSLTLRPGAPPAAVGGSVQSAVAAGAFLVGAFALLVALGLSGWLRSRRLGLITSTAAVVGAFAILVLVAVR